MQSSRFQIDAVTVDALSLHEAALGVCRALRSRTASFCVFTLNLDHVVKLRSNSAFRRAYERARIVLADGFPIALAGRLQGKDVWRTTGSDFIAPLCAEAARQGIPVVLFGSTLASLSRAARKLHDVYRDLHIVGVYAPPNHFDVHSDEADRVVEFIRNSGAKICFVALGAPKQEIFADRCAERTEGIAFVCIGAGLDFLAGSQTRAPKLFQAIGAEWLWRLTLDPRRLASRYMACLWVLPSVLLRAMLMRYSG